MVNLTQPAVLCFKGRVPEDKITRNHYLQVESYLQRYKEVLINDDQVRTFLPVIGLAVQSDST